MKVAATFLFLSLSGCDVLGIGVACTLEAQPGITVLVVDSVSGGVVGADEITVVVRDGPYTDSLQIRNAQTSHAVELASERRGTYRVEVSANGYIPWVMQGVEVTENECHVRTVELVARLQRN